MSILAGMGDNHFYLDSLPFDIGFYKTWPPKLPRTMRFEIFVDPQTDLIREKVDQHLRINLKHYYEGGGYASTPLGEGPYATGLGDFFIRGVEAVLNETKKTIAGSTFLEIGSGYGYVPYKLGQLGAPEAIGVEPGQEGVEASARYGVSIIQDFYPTKKLDGREFDVILSHCMLEHIEDPLSMLKAMYDSTREGGVVLFAVPDCRLKMAIGDITIVSHQHINYFTSVSAHRLLAEAGFSEIGIIRSPKRSLLFAWGVKRIPQDLPGALPPEGPRILAQFSKNFTANVHAIQRIVDVAVGEGKTIGLYAPEANVAGLIHFPPTTRMFNSDSAKAGRYLSASLGPIELPADLIAKPTDILIIAAIDYDDEIRNDLLAAGLSSSVEIISLKTLYQGQSGLRYDTASNTSNGEFVVEH